MKAIKKFVMGKAEIKSVLLSKKQIYEIINHIDTF